MVTISLIVSLLVVLAVVNIFLFGKDKLIWKTLYGRQGFTREEQRTTHESKTAALHRKLRLGVNALVFLLVLFLLASLSWVIVPNGKVGHLNRIYIGSPLPPGQYIAKSGQLGPQAQILPPGFHISPFIRVLNDIMMEDEVVVQEGQYAFLTAKDGAPLQNGAAFADAWKISEHNKMWSDAEYFLSNGGQRGPQVSVLTPGNYRVNRFLFEVDVTGKAVEVKAGEVAVITSAVHGEVNFGSFQRPKPNSAGPIVQEVGGQQLATPLVAVGNVGVWSEPLSTGRYYINERAYRHTIISTQQQVLEYKGGYTSKEIHLEVDEKGQITQKPDEDKIEKPENAAGEAIEITLEGWTLNQEIRTNYQVKPENAPVVVVLYGNLENVVNRLITPTIRTSSRNILTSGEVDATTKDGKGKRRIQVLDILDYRPQIEKSISEQTARETARYGVTIEVLMGVTDLPPELLVARRREQLAGQLQKAYDQEQLAQTRRIEAEKARATANQQEELVRAEIEVKRSAQLMQARENEGLGEQKKLKAIAEGEQARVAVLGQENVVALRRYELLLEKVMTFVESENGQKILNAALSNPQKFVPNDLRIFNMSGHEASANPLVAPAAILGDLMSSGKSSGPATATQPASSTNTPAGE